jgi:hypothetical protein
MSLMEITADEMRALRESSGMGLMEIRKILVGRKLRAILAVNADPERLRDVLNVLVEDMYPVGREARLGTDFLKT